MGGRVSEEFQAITKLGEDIILYNEEKNVGINKEVLDFEDKETFIDRLQGLSLEDMKEYNSVELGNNFELGTKYSEAMGLTYQDENGQSKPYYMGCYGIGLGRIIATTIENNIIIKNDRVKGFAIPENIAPYKVQIIYSDENKEKAFELYNKLQDNGVNAIIDDRENLNMGNRINDVYALGTPYMLVMGKKFEDGKYELETSKTGEKEVYTLDELINLPIPYTKAKWNSNAFNGTFYSCERLKNITFALNDGVPYTVTWKSQVIDLSSYVGYANYKSHILNYNSGITADKEVTDDASYQLLKNDPDWFATKREYSRYNHDSAVRTINSLPDTSAYLATAGGTNTIKFEGKAGASTDGGAINTLTEEEIAVAAAKGWTVTLV